MQITLKVAPSATLRSLLDQCGLKPPLCALPSRKAKVETPQDRQRKSYESTKILSWRGVLSLAIGLCFLMTVGFTVQQPPLQMTAYVANAGSNSVSVVDIKTMKEITRISVGQVPKRNTTAMLQAQLSNGRWYSATKTFR
jgi:YVTN family beta-propeller protein